MNSIPPRDKYVKATIAGIPGSFSVAVTKVPATPYSIREAEVMDRCALLEARFGKFEDKD